MANFEETLSVEQNEALKLLECPICMEVAHPPIYQCPLGHLVCCNCIDKVTKCPTCRSPMPEVPIRNILVEKLTENIPTQNCPNSNFGCQAKFKYGENIDLHLQDCDFCSGDYCNQIGLGKFLGCTKIITKRDISSHLKVEHKLDSLAVDNYQAEIIQEIDNIRNKATRKWLPVTFSVFNEHFFLVSELPKKRTGEFGAVSWKCIVAAPKSVAREFMTKITLVNPEKKLELRWKGPALSIDEINEDLNYFSIPFETLKLFNNSKYHNTKTVEWAIKVTITRNSPLNQPSQGDIVQSVRTTTYSVEENEKDSEKVNLDSSTSHLSPPDVGTMYFSDPGRLPIRSFFSSVGSIPDAVRNDVRPLPSLTRTASPAKTRTSLSSLAFSWRARPL